MNLNASFCKKIENGMLYRHPKAVGPKTKRGKFRPFGVPFNTPNVLFNTPKVLNWLLDTERSFVFGCRLGSFSRVFWPVLAPRRVFILRLWFFIFIFIFLNNLGFFRNNYFIDKYPKISLDKVHIIHNFIVIQSSLLFLCMHPYFKHYYQPITKLFN